MVKQYIRDAEVSEKELDRVEAWLWKDAKEPRYSKPVLYEHILEAFSGMEYWYDPMIRILKEKGWSTPRIKGLLRYSGEAFKQYTGRSDLGLHRSLLAGKLPDTRDLETGEFPARWYRE